MPKINKELGTAKLLAGTQTLIEAGELLGLDRKAPAEFNKMKFTVVKLKEEKHGK